MDDKISIRKVNRYHNQQNSYSHQPKRTIIDLKTSTISVMCFVYVFNVQWF